MVGNIGNHLAMENEDLKKVWQEMEEIEPLTPIPSKNNAQDIIKAKVMFDSDPPSKPLSKWR